MIWEMKHQLDRGPLRDQIRAILRQAILAGTPGPEARVGIFDLARELGTSPTPVREAMAQLERSGFLVAEPSRGFFVAELSEAEVADLYPMIWHLESLGATSGDSGSESPQRIARLRDINVRIAQSDGDPLRAAKLDRQWHQEIISGCGNTLLAQVLGDLKDRAARYENAFMRGGGQVAQSVDEHEQMIRAIEDRELRRVRTLVKRHWRRSLMFVQGWLRQRSRPSTGHQAHKGRVHNRGNDR